MTKIVTDFPLFSCLVVFVCGIVLAAANLAHLTTGAGGFRRRSRSGVIDQPCGFFGGSLRSQRWGFSYDSKKSPRRRGLSWVGETIEIEVFCLNHHLNPKIPYSLPRHWAVSIYRSQIYE
jgi:hypothetical protein